MKLNIQLISAPSILGLKPEGVELLAACLIDSGLAKAINADNDIVSVPTLNGSYSSIRDEKTHCINAEALASFSLNLSETVATALRQGRFPLVLGGDCSILIGIMAGLRSEGNYGLIFLDAHADFYEPEKSITGEVADMDLAIITGRGPDLLCNLKQLKPYVTDENVVHIGQRDWEETKKYGSQDIKQTAINCLDLAWIENAGIDTVLAEVSAHISQLNAPKCWIHFDTDVLADNENPAVDYRLPGGLSFNDCERLLKGLLLTDRIAGLSVTIFNPTLDGDGKITKQLENTLGRAFDLKR